jgi:molybdate/tungstate transport system ATP-binding protein
MIEVCDLCVIAGEFRIEKVSFTIPTGQFGVLMGQTGSGKTTILESVLGLRRVTSGTIRLFDEDVTTLNPAVRGIGYVPQDGALFSTMTIRSHLDFALMIRKAPEDQCKKRVAELAELLGIEHLLDREPQGLSGGERQRVALGRALSFYPKVLCLDEPLSALDDDTRGRMCDLLTTVQKKTGTTILHVTHNRDEAERLADCLLRIEGGKVIVETKNSENAKATPTESPAIE